MDPVIGGDISNVSPPRWLVTLDVMTDGFALPKKRAWKTWDGVAKATPLDQLVNGRLWQISSRYSAVFDCVTFGLPDEYAEALQSRFDREGWLIRYTEAYASRHTLQASLAFRPDIYRVIDTNAFTWGSRGLTLGDALNG